MSEKNIFGLSKVLLVLGLVGIVFVSNLTLSSKSQQRNENTVRNIQRAYASLSKSYKLAKKEKGYPDKWDLDRDASPKGAKNILHTLMPPLKLAKYCGNESGCFDSSNYKNLNRSSTYNFDLDPSWAKVQLEDGSSIAVYSLGGYVSYSFSDIPLQNICGFIAVDANGIEKPNQIGVDTFMFYLTKYGILPMGNPHDTTMSFGSRCKNKNSADGWGCTAWVIYNKNIDYTKCSDLSWSGKRKCS